MLVRSSQYTIKVLAKLKFHLSADNFFTHVVEIGKIAFIWPNGASYWIILKIRNYNYSTYVSLHRISIQQHEYLLFKHVCMCIELSEIGNYI